MALWIDLTMNFSWTRISPLNPVSHLAHLHAATCACCPAWWSGQTGAGPGFPRSAAPGGSEAIAVLKQASPCVSLPIVQAVSRLQPPASPPRRPAFAIEESLARPGLLERVLAIANAGRLGGRRAAVD